MTRESGSERSQRTVAELLAQYGANSDDGAPRRRRRRADEPSDTSPQTIIDRVLSDSGNLLPVRDDPAEETTVGTQPPVRQQPPAPPMPPTASQQLPQRPVQQPPQAMPQPSQQMPMTPPAAGAQQTSTGMRPPVRPTPGRTPTPPPRIEASRTNLSRADLPQRPGPGPGQQQPTGYFRPQQPGTPPPPPQGADAANAETTLLPQVPADVPPSQNTLAARLAPGGEPVTEQLPRIAAPPVGESTQAHPGPLVDDDDDYADPHAVPPLESTQAHAGPYVDDEYEDDQYDYEYADGYSVDRDAAPAGVGGPLAELDSEEKDSEEAEGSAGRQWLMMAAQLAVGVIGGAALWLGFQWLWNALPAAALVAAVAVIVGLVIVVRRIRKADDLQTMVLAVLVGLIVTVSPAALRLIGH